MKYGLVLEGGAMRGLFTAGVIDVLMENEITFDAAVGVSAGAAFGCNYKSAQIRRAIRYNTRFCKDKRYCSTWSLIKTGDMFGGEFCYHTIPDKLDLVDTETFNNSPMDFWVVCTDITTGKAVYHKCGHLCYDELEWIRASASMPLAARIVEVGGYKLLDGGISDSIPLKFMESRGCERNVVIVTQPRDYVKKPAGAQKLIKLKYRKYPELIKSIENRHKMYNGELKYIRSAEEAGTAFVIAPPEALPIGHIEHDPEVMLEVYRIGRRIANENLEALIKFLGME
ncbi:patatin family protein [Ruminococcus flavefaciens]|uniref:patatin-like phospholipase family protein n=1 Tax=Ruminococcus flavefaciens TaxID=1265 RepID=UPI0026EE417D|nr:patatin family protein [Ruminococcus flavefaciens]